MAEPLSTPKLDTLALLAAALAFTKKEQDKSISEGQLLAKLSEIPGVEVSREALAQSARRLRSSGMLEPGRALATEEGKKRALAFLGLARSTKWRAKMGAGIVNLAIPIRVLGLPPKPKTIPSDWLLAQKLASDYDLGLEPYPTLTKAASRLAWITVANIDLSDIGEDLDRTFSGRAIQEVMYRAASGRSPPPKARDLWRRIGKAMLARDLELTREATATDVLAVVYREWLHSDDRPYIELPTASWQGEEEASVPSPTLPRDDFVEKVHRAAARCEPWTRGSRDVYIADVWDWMRHEAGDEELSFDAFKSKLVEASRSSEVVLLEAELSPATDLERKRASRIRVGPFGERHLIRSNRD